MTETILITGGCGFIGQHLARRMIEDGRRVVALDSLHPQVHLDPDASRDAFPGQVVVGDITDPAAWDQVAKHGRFDAVVHLAAETGTGQSMYERERYLHVNVDGTRLASDFASKHAVPLVSLSSRAVYGEGSADRPSFEDDPHNPVSVYGETKSLAEVQALTAADRIPLTIIRPQNVIGPGQALHNPYTGVLAAFLAMLREQRPLTVYGDGRQTRDFVHVTDLVELIVWCLANPPAAGSTWPCIAPETSTTPAPPSTGCKNLAHRCRVGRPKRQSWISSAGLGIVPAQPRVLGRTHWVSCPSEGWSSEPSAAGQSGFSRLLEGNRFSS